jgi:hypothetical protein
MENSMTGSLPNKELDRAALAAGHFEIAEQETAFPSTLTD